MKNFLSILALLLLCGCSNFNKINTLTPPRGPGREDPHPQDSLGKEEDRKTSRLAVYCCGVEVDASYNWRQDTLAGRESCSIVLYKDAERILSFPAGADNQVGVDADEHFILNGELFTSFSSEDGSVIKRNGKIFMESAERMRLQSIFEQDGHIWTLCRRLDDDGFMLHRDGSPIKESISGSAGTLHKDGEDICFCHHYTNPANGRELWYLCRNGTDIPLLPYSGFSFCSAICVDSEIWSVQQNGSNMALFKGDTKVLVYKLNGSRVGRCEIIPTDEGCALWATLHYGTQKMELIWRSNSSYEHREDGIFNVFFGKAGTMLCLYNPAEGKVSYRQWNKTTEIEGKWMLLGKSCTDFYGNAIGMALSGTDGGSPAYTLNEKLTQLDMHGYLTGISLREEEIEKTD